jgi:hypothetical protein
MPILIFSTHCSKSNSTKWRINEPIFVSVDSFPTLTHRQKVDDILLARSNTRNSRTFIENLNLVIFWLYKSRCLLKTYIEMDFQDVRSVWDSQFIKHFQLAIFFNCIGLLMVFDLVWLISRFLSSGRLRTSSQDSSSQLMGNDPIWRLYLIKQFTVMVEHRITDLTASDMIKSLFQKCTDKPILWWPFMEPVSSLQPEEVRISWFGVGRLS